MKKSDFYFDLPEELIAQTPLERRDASRLLTLDKTTGAVAHHDCLVLNDSRVLRRACSATAAPAVQSKCCCCATSATASGSA